MLVFAFRDFKRYLKKRHPEALQIEARGRPFSLKTRSERRPKNQEKIGTRKMRKDVKKWLQNETKKKSSRGPFLRFGRQRVPEGPRDVSKGAFLMKNRVFCEGLY